MKFFKIYLPDCAVYFIKNLSKHYNTKKCGCKVLCEKKAMSFSLHNIVHSIYVAKNVKKILPIAVSGEFLPLQFFQSFHYVIAKFITRCARVAPRDYVFLFFKRTNI